MPETMASPNPETTQDPWDTTGGSTLFLASATSSAEDSARGCGLETSSNSGRPSSKVRSVSPIARAWALPSSVSGLSQRPWMRRSVLNSVWPCRSR